MKELVPNAVLESPGWGTFFGVIIPILVGILSGAFVTEITIAGELQWAQFYRTMSFYGLLVVAGVTYVYHRAAYEYARDVERFLDDDYCRAYMRSKCLPEAAERYKELIRKGDKRELVNAMREFEKILK